MHKKDLTQSANKGKHATNSLRYFPCPHRRHAQLKPVIIKSLTKITITGSLLKLITPFLLAINRSRVLKNFNELISIIESTFFKLSLPQYKRAGHFELVEKWDSQHANIFL